MCTGGAQGKKSEMRAVGAEGDGCFRRGSRDARELQPEPREEDSQAQRAVKRIHLWRVG